MADKKMSQRGCASEGDHAKIAERFQAMCDVFDTAKATYSRCVPYRAKPEDYPAMKPGEPYLLTQLKHSVAKWNLPEKYSTRTSKLHQVMKKQGNDGRRSLPSALREHLQSTNFKQEKVEAKWLVCYLNDIRPDQNSPDWAYFECSHLCIEHGLDKNVICIDPRCLCWESKAINQSRGNIFCAKKCAHNDCAKTLCECQKLHNPCCH